jgi:hypothetical protein
MIATSTTQTFPFKAPWREGDEAAPTFLLRAGSVIERGQMEAELTGDFQAPRVWEYELRAAVRAGVETLLADDPSVGQLLELIDAEGGGEDVQLSEDDKRLLAEARKVLAEHWPAYRDLVAQQARRQEIAPIVALRRFCVGIEGQGADEKPITFTKGRDGFVSEETLGQIDPLELKVAGGRAYSLQFPGTGARNFPPPSPSGESQQNSKPEPPAAAGSSGRKGGRKTPGSRSPRGSGQS